MLVALASTEYRARTGTWPDTTSELGLPAALLIDVCSGSPIRLRGDSAGLLVYAAGPDLDDDGGRARDLASDDPMEGDLVFALRFAHADTAVR